MDIDGQCHCGRTRFAAVINPEDVVVCHCIDCQELTGTAFRVTVRAKAADVVVSGEPPKTYEKTAASGRKRLQHFCPECGSPLFSSDAPPGPAIGIRWGTITQRDQLAPRRQIWCRSAAPWIADVPALAGKDQE